MQNKMKLLLSFIYLYMHTSTYIISSHSNEESDDEAFPKCGFSQVDIVEGNEMTDEDYQKESHLIVGGQTARRGSWPWVVFLENRKEFFCGGSIITNEWILTAAHCIKPHENTLGGVTVTMGAHVRSEISFEQIKMKLKRAIMHPEFQNETLKNDIGLMELEEPILFHAGRPILPVCLPVPEEELATGTMTYVTGWGRVEAVGQVSDILKQAMVPVLEMDRCLAILHTRRKSFTLQNSTFCTHYKEGGHNSCVGDSGSPLMVRKDNLWVQHGIVSWGMWDCAEIASPSVFTKVSAFVPWIKNITNNAKIRFFENK